MLFENAFTEVCMPLRLNTPLPDLSGATEWINGQPDFKAITGQPLLVYFWAVSCHVCHENMPRIYHWREQYGPKGLQLIAVHIPRQESDTNVAKVREHVQENHITDPCGVDNKHQVKQAFDNALFPAYFLFDREGKLRRRAAGHAGISLLEPVLEQMFA